jgi:hypothetical protein
MGIEKEANVFNAGKWLFEVIRTIGVYRTVNDFILDKNAQTAYLESRKVVTYFEKDEEFFEEICEDKETIKLFHDDVIESISDTSKFYNRQVIVLASTYVELILKDFLLIFFKQFPERMYEFIYEQDKQESKGSISLKEVLKVKNIDDLMEQLSNQATANLLKGKLSSQLKNLMKITKHNFDDDLTNELIQLNEFRNSIVHENLKSEIDSIEVEKAIDTCDKLVRVLATISQHNKIVLDTYVPFH